MCSMCPSQLMMHMLSTCARVQYPNCLYSHDLAMQCLMYACQVEPIVPEQEVVSLVKLLHSMAKDFQGISLRALSLVSHCIWMILFSLFQCFC